MEIIDNNLHSVEEVIPETPKDNNVFKGEEPRPTNEESKNSSNIDDSLAFSIYEQIKGVPYTIKYFNMNSNLFSDRSAFKDGQTLKMARHIDDFVSDEIERRNLIDSIESYHMIIDDLQRSLGINILEKSSSVLEKLYNYVKRNRGITAYGK